ncbi:MAG: PIN domain-containing protein [Anaerolineales bacterium]|nr:PIN domain-containing protein [Anaerolineales bacterium]
MNDNSNFQFVDSNILVYAYDNTQGDKHQIAITLLENLWAAGVGCLSVQVLQEFYYNITHKSAKPLAPAMAAQVIEDFSDWIIHRPGIRDVLAAIELLQRHNISFWDAMILRSAQQCNCSRLLTEDLSNGQRYENVTVINPFA